MIITDHAARRYVKRLALNITVAQARADLQRASSSATLMPERTYKGQQLWQTEGCHNAVLVVKHDPADGLVVVTVLGPNHAADDEAEHSVLAAFERAESAREAPQPVGETWREKYDRLNREAEEAEKRRAERAQRRVEHAKLNAAAADRRRTKGLVSASQEREMAEAKERKAKRIADHEARVAKAMEEAKERKAVRAAAHVVRMAEAKENRAVYIAQWSRVLP